MKIAIQGEIGSFSHQASLAMVPRAKILPCQRSMHVFESVIQGKAQGAVIPIENSLAGSVPEHYDLLLKYDLFIEKEYNLHIIHNLITTRGSKLKDIKKIYSHPVALDQCRHFLSKFPNIQVFPYYDTAGSVHHIIQEQLNDSAAIASKLAAKKYKGIILKKNIEDNKQNYTRFLLVTKKPKFLSKANKTSVAFYLQNKPGTLFKALSVFALRDIDLCKIESRPVPGSPWQYVFYVDLLRGHDQILKNALRNLAEVADPIKILGIYRRA